ncbi:hypothetical protein D4Z93_09670 [Clostridium fermenticellae]|uniref:Uncharacterized protein n=1 Tax=Clostridium fermenticellae TaxID=2068654 RepID=A0A386H6V5_9CLOT|nr:hypothetical protein D4Z93_09670 [Clostridium fermenticellae]
MLRINKYEKCEKLLDKLYSKCSYNEFLIAFDVAVRAYYRIVNNDFVFYDSNFYMGRISCEDRLISTVCNYYLKGNGKRENLDEDIFTMINVLSGNKESIEANELRGLFSKVYEN